ncbi:DUF1707 domain-containing protein, partial [Kitasatospora sp. NPDC002543]
MRVTDADRETVAELLRDAYAEGSSPTVPKKK